MLTYSEAAPNAARSLVSNNVNFVIGHVCSGATIRALPIYAESNVICVTASATNPMINQGGQYPYFFRTVPNDFDQGRAIIDYLTRNNLEHALLVFERNSYSESVIQAVKHYADVESLLVDYCQYEANDSSIYFQEGANVQRIFDSLDAAIYAGYYIEFPQVYGILRSNLQFNGPIIGSDGIKDDKLFQLSKFSYLNCYAVALPQTTTGMAEDLMQVYREKYQEDVGPNYLNAFTAASILIGIYEQNQNLLTMPIDEQAELISQILRSENFITPLGKISFTSEGDIEQYGFHMYEMVSTGFEMLRE